MDGKIYKWKFSHQKARRSRAKSAPHKAAISFLLQIFPNTTIMEEVTIPGASSMYLDIYLPLIPLAVEVHGKQHYEHIPFFHKSKAEFLLSQKRDRDKAAWADLNNIPFVVLPYDKETDWWQLINSAISQD